MKKLVVLIVLFTICMPALWAGDGGDQHLSREDFRVKQQAYIIEKAGLSKEEAARFFPVYFELQDKKNKLNDQSWKLIRKGRDEKTTEAQYQEINEQIVANRIEADQLDKVYLHKFKKLLSNKKIYLVQGAEMRFSREMIKGMHKKEEKRSPKK